MNWTEKMVFGYCRISTKKQNLERQVKNIERAFPEAVIIKEAFTGTKMGRPEWGRLYKRIRKNPDVVVVFDDVSRMSRNAEEGFQLYMELFSMGATLVFLKEPHINTDSYRQAMGGILDIPIQSGDHATDRMVHAIMDAVNEFIKSKVRQDIYRAFEQAQKEVDFLHQRTKEGIERARGEGKQIGGIPGKKLVTKKSIEKKKEIRKHSIDFGGSLNDRECMKLTGLSRNTFYKYKKELKDDLDG